MTAPVKLREKGKAPIGDIADLETPVPAPEVPGGGTPVTGLLRPGPELESLRPESGGAPKTMLETLSTGGPGGRAPEAGPVSQEAGKSSDVVATEQTPASGEQAGGPEPENPKMVAKKACETIYKTVEPELLAAFRAKNAEARAIIAKLKEAKGNPDEWANVLPLLQAYHASAFKVAQANKKVAALAPLVEQVKAFDACHLPPNLDDLTAEILAAIESKDFSAADAKIGQQKALLDQAIDMDTRFKAILKETDGLTDKPQKDNMIRWNAEHKAMTWAESVKNDTTLFVNGGLSRLQNRLDGYAGRSADKVAEAKRVAAGVVEAKANAKLKAAKEAEERKAAKVIRDAQIAAGLLAGDGSVIEAKEPTALNADDVAPVQEALALIPGTVKPDGLWPGAKWGEPHENRDGYLPGEKGAGGYLEYYVKPEATAGTGAKKHGARRLVRHIATGRVYFTNNHYGANKAKPAFVLVRS